MRAFAKLNHSRNRRSVMWSRVARGRDGWRAHITSGCEKYSTTPRPERALSGAVLLEVVLALVLFVGAAVIIGEGLYASMNGVERLRLSAHGANLAQSILSELQMGSRSAGDGSPEPFAPPFDTWMWQVQTMPFREEQTPSAINQPDLAPPGLMQVQVVVRDTDSDFVYRLSQLMPANSLGITAEKGATF